MKKFFCILVVAFLSFTFTACTASSLSQNELEKLNQRISELEEENKKLKDKIAKYEEQQSFGEFYSLQQAYDSGLLTQDDLKSIAYYYNGGIEGNEETMGVDFQPQSMTPEILDKITEFSIKQTYCNYLHEERAEPSGVTLVNYCGVYNGCYAVVLDSIYIAYPLNIVNKWETVGGVNFHYCDHLGIDIWKATQGEDIDETLATQIKIDYAKYGKYDSNDLRLSVYGEYKGTCVMFIDGPWYYQDVITTETVGGVEFVYSSSRKLKAYKDGNFYSLGEAYENQLLTRVDLLDVHAKYESKQFKIY